MGNENFSSAHHASRITDYGLSKSVILGTAGHIDHGKSSLVKAITGTDPDRLKEEKERGITIDLGFANISYPDGMSVGIVDVPGHERLIKNMLAGAGGIDIVLMVIAADEGIMPQSREHLAICELLKIKSGIIVITKADLVDSEWLEMVIDDVKGFVNGTLLQGAPIIAVSAKTGMNIYALKEAIRKASLNVKPKLTEGLFRLPIDRVFTLKGFGTVVTGTASSGTISVDSLIEILPANIKTKVRGLQSHGRTVERAYAGQRIGVNLQGVERELLKRGDVVVSPDRFTTTNALDAKLEMLKDAPTLKSRSLVHFYTGTAETIARIIIYDKEEIKAGETCYCQLRLHDPIIALSSDRYIIRRFSPLQTIGGGEILDPHPIKRRKREGISDLITIEKGALRDKIEAKIKMSHLSGCLLSEIEGWIQGDIPEIMSSIERLLKEGRIVKKTEARGQRQEEGYQPSYLFHKTAFAAFKESLISELREYHQENPLKHGMTKEQLKARISAGQADIDRLLDMIPQIEDVVAEGGVFRLKGFKASLSDVDEGIKSKILGFLNKGGFQPPLKEELASLLSINEKELNDLLRFMTKQSALVRINDSIFITTELFNKMIGLLRDFYSRKKEMSVAEFRDILGTSRKYAVPFLEYLDSNKITLRVGDIRKFMLK